MNPPNYSGVALRPKRFYSVKEAAELLAVSTNTIYTYLKENKMTSRRFGRGRFKIPYTSLLPYIEPSESSVTKVFPRQSGSDLQTTSAESEPDTDYVEKSHIEVGANDILFYRLFKALALIGAGVIHLTIRPVEGFYSQLMGGDIDVVMLSTLPHLLVLAGLILLVNAVNNKLMIAYRVHIHAFTALVLGYYALVSISTGSYGLLIFSGSFLGMTILHILAGIRTKSEHTFLSQFSKFTALLVIISGLVLVIDPDLFPIQGFAQIVSINKSLAVLLWFGTLIPILSILISNNERSDFLRTTFFSLAGIFAFIMATQLSITGSWTVSYLSYITGIFALFLVAWHIFKINIESSKLYLVMILFVWITSSTLFSIFAINSYQKRVIQQAAVALNSNLQNITNQISDSFARTEAILISKATDKSFIDAVLTDDSTTLTAGAKDMFESLDIAQRVIVYDSEGKSLAVYPHLSMGLGVDYSERDYFQRTKATNRGYVSNVFTNILGGSTLMQTEPVFRDNQFAGMVGVAISLDTLSERYQTGFGSKTELVAIDAGGKVVFATDKNRIGHGAVQIDSVNRTLSKDKINIYQSVRNPRWEVYASVPTATVLGNASEMNVVVTVLILFNAVVSIGAVLVFANRKNLISGKTPRHSGSAVPSLA